MIDVLVYILVTMMIRFFGIALTLIKEISNSYPNKQRHSSYGCYGGSGRNYANEFCEGSGLNAVIDTFFRW
jgi:hypothetical protein